MEEREGMLDEIQLAKKFSLDHRTLQKWRREGTGPPFVVLSKKCVRYPLKDIEKWIADRTVSSTKEGKALNNVPQVQR